VERKPARTLKKRGTGAQSRRDCVLQPRVASLRATLGTCGRIATNPERVAPSLNIASRNPFRVVDSVVFTQGCSFLATLGFEAESLWDSYRDNAAAHFGIRCATGRRGAATLPTPLSGLNPFHNLLIEL
jgi:hypothetical protein